MNIPEGFTHEQDAHVVKEMEKAKIMDLSHRAAEEGITDVVEEASKTHRDVGGFKRDLSPWQYTQPTSSRRESLVYIETRNITSKSPFHPVQRARLRTSVPNSTSYSVIEQHRSCDIKTWSAYTPPS